MPTARGHVAHLLGSSLVVSVMKGGRSLNSPATRRESRHNSRPEGEVTEASLSPGEQQRIAFARVLLARPRAVFLDEATSALDEGQEFELYRTLRSRLPDCVVVSVSHRPAVERHHARRLELLGGGAWRLTTLAPPLARSPVTLPREPVTHPREQT